MGFPKRQEILFHILHHFYLVKLVYDKKQIYFLQSKQVAQALQSQELIFYNYLLWHLKKH